MGLEKITAQMTADQRAAITVFEDLRFRQVDLVEQDPPALPHRLRHQAILPAPRMTRHLLLSHDLLEGCYVRSGLSEETETHRLGERRHSSLNSRSAP
jgi:hypothetical protein